MMFTKLKRGPRLTCLDWLSRGWTTVIVNATLFQISFVFVGQVARFAGSSTDWIVVATLCAVIAWACMGTTGYCFLTGHHNVADRTFLIGNFAGWVTFMAAVFGVSAQEQSALFILVYGLGGLCGVLSGVIWYMGYDVYHKHRHLFGYG